MFAVVDAAFRQRRKTLRAALSGWAGSAPEAERLLRAAGLDPGARGESLGIAEFARLAASRLLNTTGRTAYDLTIVTGVTVRVPAKLNLQLAVGPPRADGYHDLVTVFHAVSLFDEITAEPARRDGVSVSGEGADRVPADGDNLALRAVAALRAEVPSAPGVHITIAKRIPVAAGLAGGSGDAAAALVACNELWDGGLGPPQLAEIAAAVGSDVAFALLGGTAVGRGRGEQLTPGAGPGDAVPLGARLRRRAPVHARGVRGAGPAAGPGGRPGDRGPGRARSWTPRSCRRCARAMPGWSAGR